MLRKHVIITKDKDGKTVLKRVPIKFASKEVAIGAEHFPLHFDDEDWCRLWEQATCAQTDVEKEKAYKALDEYENREIRDWEEKHPYYPYK